MTRVKHEHFVPQFYLKQFSEDSKRLHVFDKRSQQVFVSLVKDVASRTGFYDWTQEETNHIIGKMEQDKSHATGAKLEELQKAIDALREQTQFVEIVHLGKIETSFSKTYHRILGELDSNNPHFASNTREEFSLFIALQFLRTIEAREDLRERSNKVAEAGVKL